MKNCSYFRFAKSDIEAGRKMFEEFWGFKPSVNQYIMHCISIVDIEPQTISTSVSSKVRMLGVERSTVRLNERSIAKLIKIYARKKIAVSLTHLLTAIIIAVTLSLRNEWKSISKSKSHRHTSRSKSLTRMDLLSSMIME